MRASLCFAAAILAGTMLGPFAGRVEAQLIPGGSFEPPPPAPAMTPPWIPTGDVGTVAGVLAGVPAWSPTHLAQFAVMTNSAPGNDVPPVPPVYAGSAGLFAGGPVGVGILEAALGVPAGSLAVGFAGFAATEGSGILHPGFAVATTSTLSFDAMFATNENFRGLPGIDFAFVSVDGGLPMVLFAGPQPNGPLPPNGLFGFDSFGFSTFSSIVLGPGIHTIAFGVLDTLDGACSSALYLDNLRLTPIPEPGTVLTACAFAAMAGWSIRRCRKK